MLVWNPADTKRESINTLKEVLNPICHLLALLGAHLIFQVSRIRVNVVLTATCRE